MPDGRADRVRATGAALTDLLQDAGPCRDRWEAVIVRDSPREGVINQAAVAVVLANYAWSEGELAEHAPPRSLKERVRLALAGQRLSRTTLRWFVEGFRMSQADATRLSRAYHGQRGSHPAARGARLAAGTDGMSVAWPELPTDPHTTARCIDHQYLGPDRTPRRHRTRQWITATVDDYRVYPYRFDTPHAVVFVEKGGSAGPVHEGGPGLWLVDIELDQSLSAGAGCEVIYDTVFSYDTPPPPVFRRGARRYLDDFDIHVHFDPAALPAEVYWTIWSLPEDLEVVRERVDLDAEHTVHRHVDRLAGVFAGFTWTWPTPR